APTEAAPMSLLCPSCRSPLSRLPDGRLACRACRKAYRPQGWRAPEQPVTSAKMVDLPEDEISTPDDLELGQPPRVGRASGGRDVGGPGVGAALHKQALYWGVLIAVLVLGVAIWAAIGLIAAKRQRDATEKEAKEAAVIKAGLKEMCHAYQEDVI